MAGGVREDLGDVVFAREATTSRALGRFLPMTTPASLRGPEDSGRIHLGVQLGTAGVAWSELQQAAREVEAYGYDSLWVSDHVLGREPGRTRLEAWEVLAGLATVTARVRLGPLVSPVTFRHPALLAVAAATLDRISAGRAILGLGAGGMAEEHRRYGLPFGALRERSERLGEAATVIRSLLDQPRTTFSGHYFQMEHAEGASALQARLPLLVAGGERAAVRIAARCADLWNTIALPETFARRVRLLGEQLRSFSRGPSELLPTASFRLLIREREADVARRIDELDPSWRDDPYRLTGTGHAVLEQLRAYVAAGARGLIVQMPTPYDLTTLERFARDLRPQLASSTSAQFTAAASSAGHGHKDSDRGPDDPRRHTFGAPANPSLDPSG